MKIGYMLNRNRIGTMADFVAKFRLLTTVDAEARREAGVETILFPPLAIVTLMRDSRLSKKLRRQVPYAR